MDLMDIDQDQSPVWGLKADEVEDIEFTTENPNKVSQEKLFPINFSKSPISGGQFIERATMNGILHTITKQNYINLLSRGMAPYIDEFCLDQGYPYGAFVKVLYDIIDGELTTVKKMREKGTVGTITFEERRALATILTLQSTIDKNKNSALIKENLFKYWKVEDGNCEGTLVQCGFNIPAPPGYLDLGYEMPAGGGELLFNLEDFPRVATILKTDFADCTPFEKRGDTQFTVKNLSGLFLRIYNNNYIQGGVTPRDPGRSFSEIQKDTMCPLIGAVRLLGYNGLYNNYGELQEGVISMRAWLPVTNINTQFQNDPKYAHLKEIGDFNVFKPIQLPTGYELSSTNYQNYIADDTTTSNTGLLAITANTLTFDSTDHPNTGHEVRPKNACMKLYIKV